MPRKKKPYPGGRSFYAAMAKKKPARKKRRSPRKRATTEKEVREQIARYERLQEQWLAKLTAATKAVNKYSKKVAYYNGRLEVLATKREEAGLRDIDINDLET